MPRNGHHLIGPRMRVEISQPAESPPAVAKRRATHSSRIGPPSTPTRSSLLSAPEPPLAELASRKGREQWPDQDPSPRGNRRPRPVAPSTSVNARVTQAARGHPGDTRTAHPLLEAIGASPRGGAPSAGPGLRGDTGGIDGGSGHEPAIAAPCACTPRIHSTHHESAWSVGSTWRHCLSTKIR